MAASVSPAPTDTDVAQKKDVNGPNMMTPRVSSNSPRGEVPADTNEDSTQDIADDMVSLNTALESCSVDFF